MAKPTKIKSALDHVQEGRAAARNAYAVGDLLCTQLAEITLKLRRLEPFLEKEPQFQEVIDRIEKIQELRRMMELGDLSIRAEKLFSRAFDNLP